MKVLRNVKLASKGFIACGISFFIFLLLVCDASASGILFMNPEYHLAGTADFDYLSDKANVNGISTNVSSFTQIYSFHLNGPIVGPYLGMFNLNTSLSLASASVDDEESNVNRYLLGGSAIFFPAGKVPFSIYYNTTLTSREFLGLVARDTSDSFGISFNPRLWRGTTILDYNYFSNEGTGSVTFSNWYDTASLYYEDLRRFDDSMLHYQYRLTHKDEVIGDQTQNELTNSLGLTYLNKFSQSTQGYASFFLDYTDQHGTLYLPGSYGSTNLTTAVSHDFTPSIKGSLNFNDTTYEQIVYPTTTTEILQAILDYSNIPNPVPNLAMIMRASAGWESDTLTGRNNNAALSLSTLWSKYRSVDVSNYFAYSYTQNLSNQNAAALNAGVSEDSDFFAYDLALRGRNTTLNWYAGYNYQKEGVFTSFGGDAHSVAVGEVLSQRNFINQSDFVFRKTNSQQNGTSQQLWLHSISNYIIDPYRSAQLYLYVLDSDVSARGSNSSNLQEYLDLGLNWRPYERIIVFSGADVSHSSGTGGEGVAYGFRGILTYFLNFFVFNVNYSYTKESFEGVRSSDSRLEMRLSTGFGATLGRAGS